MFLNSVPEILNISKDLLCHLKDLNVKCFCHSFSNCSLYEGQREYGAGGGYAAGEKEDGKKKNMSHQHSDLMYIIYSRIREAEIPHQLGFGIPEETAGLRL